MLASKALAATAGLTPGRNWEPLFYRDTLRGVAWSGSLYVAISSVGTILTSSDAVTWVAVPSPTTNQLYGVAWNGTRFVAVGTNVALTSTNGTAWSQVGTILNAVFAVVWSGSQFVAVGVGGNVWRSADGTAWTSASSTSTSANLYAITWGNSLFVAAGASGVITTSPDGITWTTRLTLSTGRNWYSVVWSGSQFLVGGSLVGAPMIYSSTDGITWSFVSDTGINSSQPITGLVWDGSQFVTVTEGTSSQSGGIYTSPTGATWTARTATDVGLYAVIWTGVQFVAVGRSSLIYTSANGATWTKRTSLTPVVLNGVAYNGTNTIVAVGRSGTAVVSSDGVNWSLYSMGSPQEFYSVAWNGTVFVAVGTAGTIRRSTDGITWVASTSGTTDTLYNVVWDTSFKAVGNAGRFITSNDGISWSGGSQGAGYSLRSYVSDGVTNSVVVGLSGVVLYSTGFGYNQTLNPVGSTLWSVCWTGTRFLIGGSGGGLYTSTDGGFSWGSHTSGTTEQIYSVTAANSENIIAVGGAGAALFSINATVWSAATGSAKQGYRSAVFVPDIGNRYVAVGDDGQISLSPPAGVTRVI